MPVVIWHATLIAMAVTFWAVAFRSVPRVRYMQQNEAAVNKLHLAKAAVYKLYRAEIATYKMHHAEATFYKLHRTVTEP